MRTLLIDADVLAYGCASANEKVFEVEPGYYTWHCDVEEVKVAVDETIALIKTKLKGDEVKLCLTDNGRNWRKDVLPTYKGNRANVKKPVALLPIRQWLIEERGAYLRPSLEGDDCMGILATYSKLKGEKVIVSVDKDMKTIPGLFCRWGVSERIVKITEAEADYWHLYQTLTGDTTDGYAGCPGVGPKSAEKILKDPKFGKPDWTPWDRVVKTYEKAGLTEDDALQQARVARILRATDYDFNEKRPILWTPQT